MRVVAVVSGFILLAAAIGGGKLIGARKELVSQREGIGRAWAELEISLGQRAAFVPGLVEKLSGFGLEERNILESAGAAGAELMRARTPQEKMEANARLDEALGRLLVAVEDHAELPSSERFLRLLDELARLENRIAVDRRKYNETVQKYNTSIELFPSNVAASLFGLSRNDDYFRTGPAARTVPKAPTESLREKENL